MKVRFWGVRGSIPVPGPETVRVGGNTLCVEVATPDGQVVVLDAGTGIRALGADLLGRGNRPQQVVLLLSHTHWDHIQGLPFFAPLRQPGYRVTIVGERRTCRALAQVLATQMDEPFLPFAMEDLAAELAIEEIEDGQELAAGEHTAVLARRLPHPGSVLGFRIAAMGRSLVYVTDTGHPDGGLDPGVMALAQGADLLIHDAHFTPQERADCPDWGHSSWEEAVRVAQVAGVRRLALFHHAPERTDEQVEQIGKEARARFPGTFLAREGLEVEV